MTLSHYKFRKRLEFNCYKKNREFVLRNEAYTSQVYVCFSLRYQVGYSKFYDCPTYKYTADRDLKRF